MPCYHVDMPGGGSAIVRGRLGPHCADCSRLGEFLCDFPVGELKTCDRAMCTRHRNQVAPGVDYCAGHYAEWQVFHDAGGVSEVLSNLVPFIQPDLF